MQLLAGCYSALMNDDLDYAEFVFALQGSSLSSTPTTVCPQVAAIFVDFRYTEMGDRWAGGAVSIVAYLREPKPALACALSL